MRTRFAPSARWWRRACRLAAAAVIAAPVAVLAAAPVEAGQQRVDLFGSQGTRFTGVPPSRKFLGVLERFAIERAPGHDNCRNAVDRRCLPGTWGRLLAELSDASPLAQVVRVNRVLNRVDYVDDADNYGIEDYWATPGEFLARGGDCEDYAVAKFLALRALGFDDERLQVVVVWDEELDIGHAVLVVDVEGRELVLDNRRSWPRPSRVIDNYRPFYAVSETTWTLYRGSTPTIATTKLSRAFKAARGGGFAPVASKDRTAPSSGE
jgi:predicted transglutaminase-like cysteine proteinase